MFTYRKRNTFLQGLHPLTGVCIILFYIVLFLKINNPIYILLILLSLITLSYMDNSIKSLFSYAKIMIPFALLIALLNPLLVHTGNTVLYKGYINYPVIGRMIITLEAVIYGLFSGIRVLSITVAFGFSNLIIHPDRAFSFFSKFLKKSSLLMSMTIRLFPTMMSSYENIVRVEKLRGNKVFNKDMKKSIINSGNITNILFLSSLEDSSDMAESMYSRGYGALKKRSSYFYERFKIYDGVIILGMVISIIILEVFQSKGLNVLNFYPKVDNPIKCLSLEGLMLCGSMFIPTVINWWWKVWK